MALNHASVDVLMVWECGSVRRWGSVRSYGILEVYGDAKRWKMEDGRWKMEDGRWKMEDGRWKMEDGRWKMEDGRWKMEDGRWKMEVCEGLVRKYEASPRGKPVQSSSIFHIVEDMVPTHSMAPNLALAVCQPSGAPFSLAEYCGLFYPSCTESFYTFQQLNNVPL